MSFMESYTRLMGSAYGPSPYESSSMMGGAMMVGGSSGLGDYASQLSLGGDTYMTGFSNPFGGAFADFFRGFGRPSSFGSFMGGDAMATYRATVQDSWRLQPPNVLGMFGGGAAGQAGGAGGAGGTGQTGGAGSTTNTEATTEADKPKITDDMKNTAVTRLQGLGYSESDARSIVDKIASEVGDSVTDFSDILGKVPVRSTTNEETGQETVREDWTEKFGMWYSKYILDMDGAQAKDYVHSVAFTADTPFEAPSSATGPWLKLTNANRTEQITVGGQQVTASVFTVGTTGGGDPGIAQGTAVYKVGANGDSKYYIRSGSRYVEVPFFKSGQKYYTHMGANPNDFATMHAPTSGEDQTVTAADGKVYSIFILDDPAVDDGKAQALFDQTADDGHMVYRGADGKFYRKNGEEYVALEPAPTFENGRLNFGGEARWAVREGFETEHLTATAYMSRLEDGASAAQSATTAQQSVDDAAKKALVEAAVSDFVDGSMFDTDADKATAAKMTMTVNSDGSRLDISCGAADAEALRALFDSKLDALNTMFGNIGPDTMIYLNGQQVIAGQQTRATGIRDVLKAIASGQVAANGETSQAPAVSGPQVVNAGDETTPAEIDVPLGVSSFGGGMTAEQVPLFVAAAVQSVETSVSEDAESVAVTVDVPAGFSDADWTSLKAQEDAVIAQIRATSPTLPDDITVAFERPAATTGPTPVAAVSEPFSEPFVIEGEVPTSSDPFDEGSPYFAASAPSTIPDPTAMYESAMSVYGSSDQQSTTTVSKQLDLASVPSTSPQVLASQIRINAGALPSGTERVLITARVPEGDFAAAHTAMEDVIDILEDSYYPGVDVDLHFIMA